MNRHAFENMNRQCVDNRMPPPEEEEMTHKKYLVIVDGTQMKSCESRAQAEAWAWFFNTSPGCRAKIEEIEWQDESYEQDMRDAGREHLLTGYWERRER